MSVSASPTPRSVSMDSADTPGEDAGERRREPAPRRT